MTAILYIIAHGLSTRNSGLTVIAGDDYNDVLTMIAFICESSYLLVIYDWLNEGKYECIIANSLKSSLLISTNLAINVSRYVLAYNSTEPSDDNSK